MTEKYIGIDSIIATVLYFIAFLRMPFISIYNDVKHVILISVIVYCLTFFSYIEPKYKRINIVLLMFALWTLLSAFINRNNTVSWNIFSTAIYFVSALLGIFIALEILVSRIGFSAVIDTFFKCSLFTIIIEDLYIFSGLVSWQGDSTIFLLGSKFAVMYQHLILFWLLLESTKTHAKLKKAVIPYVVYVILIGLKVDCVTGIVGCSMFIAFLFVLRKLRSFFARPITVLIVELLAFSYVFLGFFIMSNEHVVNFIDTYMGGSGTMMARVGIYATAFPLVLMSPILGYGYGSTYEIGMQIAGFSNTQNSLYEWIWYAGVPAALLICVIILTVFGYIKRRYDENGHLDIFVMALFYVYVLLGAVEILMELPFFSILAMILISSDEVELNEKVE